MSSSTMPRYGSKEAIRSYYDVLTIFYRLFYHPVHLHYGYFNSRWDSLGKAVVAMSAAVGKALEPLTSQSRVLDAGCGIGGTSQFLAETYGCHVTGITLSEYQMNIARQRASQSKAAQFLDYQQMDYNKTSFKDGTFDRAFALECSCYAPDKRIFLQEMQRILKKKGKLVLVCWYTHKPHHQFTSEERKLYDEFCSGWEMPSLPYINDMKQWVLDAGFQATFKDISEKTWPTAWRIWWRGAACYHGAKLLAWMGFFPKPIVPHLWSCVVQYKAFRDLVSVQIITATKR